jgi:hypothetical protein
MASTPPATGLCIEASNSPIEHVPAWNFMHAINSGQFGTCGVFVWSAQSSVANAVPW